MPEDLTERARSCLFGLYAVASLWLLVLLSGAAFAQEPAPQRWTIATAVSLLEYLEQADAHGLEPEHYGTGQLEQAILSGDAERLERQATSSFGLIARDLATGRVRSGQRGRVFIASDPLDPRRIAVMIDRAIEAGNVEHTLDALAPRDPQYRALQRALSVLPPTETGKRDKIRAALERWRWLPRSPESRRLVVNIPAFRVDLYAGDRIVDSHRVIVGKTQTPTPQFSAKVDAVILNPTWTVPQSIIAESVGALVRNRPTTARARGYTWTRASNGRLQVVQQPGPQNALGQVKLDMPNPLSVYLHDTPNKDLFEREQRTFSHGCIRTDKPLDLAVTLLANPAWSRAAIDSVVSGGRTTRVPLTNPVPVYVVYMTAVADPGGQVQYLDDPYRLDQALLAKLN